MAMILKLTAFVLALPLLAVAADRKPPEPDTDGCIEAIGWCSSGPQTEQRGKTTILRFENSCPFRVYATFINGLVNGKVDAGSSGVGSGKTYVWSSQDGSGRSFVRVVGSTRSGNDWVCASKLPGFAAGDSTLERRR